MPRTLFQKGNEWRGNAKGRPPKGTALADLMRSRLDELNAEGVPYRVAMVARLVDEAVGGDLDAIRTVLERVDGKVPELRTVEGQLQIHLSWDDGTSDGD